MKEISVLIKESGRGMHARPASLFVRLASKFKSEVLVVKDGIEVNGKSILGLMMLALAPGDSFAIRAIGDDEEKAIQSLFELVENDFEIKV